GTTRTGGAIEALRDVVVAARREQVVVAVVGSVVIAAGLRDGGPHRGRESWQPQQPVPVPPRDQQPRAAVDLPAVVGAGERLRTTVGEHEVPDAHPADARRDDILQVAL